MADFHVEMASNVAPDGGGGVGSVTDQQQDDGYVNVLLNGQIVQAVTVPAGSEIDTVITVPKLTYGYQEGWQLQASNNVYFKVDGADLQQGTSAGFSQQQVTAYRGGSDGSVTMGVDGPTRGEWPIYIAMPASGVINLNGTPDDQLPSDANGNQPYFTITGPSTISLDEADSHPDLGFNVYTVPAYSQTITFHMVTPYWGQDYSDGISVTVLPQQPPGNVIPVSAGWYNVNASEFWAPNAGPESKGLYLNDHVTSEMTNARMDQLIGNMNNVDQTMRQQAVNQLISEVQAMPSAYVLNRLNTQLNSANITPESKRQLAWAIVSGANPLNVKYNPADSTIDLSLPYYWSPSPDATPTIDANHRYYIAVQSPDNRLSPYFSFANGQPLTAVLRQPGDPLSTIHLAPLQNTAIARLQISVTMEEWKINPLTGQYAWLSDGSITETVLFSVDNTATTQPQ